MSRGDRYPAAIAQGEAFAAGWRLQVYALDAPLTYVPYFYNEALDPGGRRLLLISDAAGSEQAFALDLRTGTATQLTDAAAQGQTWAPYIRRRVAGIRPQFVCWSRPDGARVLYWEANELRRVHVETLSEETLYTLRNGCVPCVPHCSETGIVCFGVLPARLQETMLHQSVEETEDALESGCGFVVLDANRRSVIAEVETPFWPNHVSASPDGRRVLHCHEGSWRKQRMYLYDLGTGERRPLRPQAEGEAIGHEFWLDERRVAYHGEVGGRSVFGIVDVKTGRWHEKPLHTEAKWAGHYHASPDGARVVTDGETTADCVSLASTQGDALHFEPLCRHDWDRTADQRYHPHPHWHATSNGRSSVTFTLCRTRGDGTQACVGVLTGGPA